MKKNFFKSCWNFTKEKFWKFHRRAITVNKLLGIGFLFSLALVIIADVFLFNLPEWFENISLGSLCRNLCFSYMTAFIFYFLNIHLQNYNTKLKHYRYVNNKIHRLDDIGTGIIFTLEKQTMIKITENDVKTPPYEKVQKLCELINPHEPVEFRLREFKNWFDLINFIDEETKSLVEDLVNVKESVDSSIMMDLLNLEDLIENHLNAHKGIDITNPSLDFCSRDLFQYRKSCEKLMSSLREKYKPYKDEYFAYHGKQNTQKNSG